MSTPPVDPDTIDEAFVAVPRPGILATDAGAETVLYHQASGGLHHLNPTAALVWRCCDGSVPLSVLIDELAEAYGSERPSVAAEVIDVVRSFAQLDLLEGITGQGRRRPTTLEPPSRPGEARPGPGGPAPWAEVPPSP